jgi:hypothetical protein
MSPFTCKSAALPATSGRSLPAISSALSAKAMNKRRAHGIPGAVLRFEPCPSNKAWLPHAGLLTLSSRCHLVCVLDWGEGGGAGIDYAALTSLSDVVLA